LIIECNAGPTRAGDFGFTTDAFGYRFTSWNAERDQIGLLGEIIADS
jgi:hypothetical protein